jgi:beta-hydroxylase
VRLIEAVPGMNTAFFSIISAGKHIPPHRGPFKGVVRHHLGLVVPEPRERCRIRVGSEVRHWEEGRSLVFDDTYEHEVWNDTDGLRVVLFLDVVRPLRFPVNLLNRLILFLIAHSPFVRDGVQNYKAWEKKLEAVVNARA